jgi:hypothetical protein
MEPSITAVVFLVASIPLTLYSLSRGRRKDMAKFETG